MTENRRRILDMLSQGKISVDEAERLLSLVEQPQGGRTGTSEETKQQHKYLRVVVEPTADADPENQERVNIRVPIALIRTGVKFTSLIPSTATTRVNEALGKQGIDIDLRNLKEEDLEQLVDALRDLEVDVQDGKQKVRVFVE